MPAGPLREKLNSLKKYDAVFINGTKINKKFLKKIKNINPNISIFVGEYVLSKYNKFKRSI